MSPDQLRALVADALNVPISDLGDDVPFDALPDYDSVARLGLLMALADAGIELQLGQASEFQTFNELHRLVKSRL
jgi:acyl carrier protein